jgi:hypothetical protein
VDERRVTAAALVVAPALFLLSNVLHPKEYGPDHEAEQLAKIAEAYGRWQAAHVITLLAALVFVFAVVGLALLAIRAGNARAGWAGGALGLVGLVGLGGALTLDGFAWGITGEVWSRSDAAGKATAELVLHDLQGSEWGLPYYLTGVFWILGMLVLAAAIARSGLVPVWAGALLGLGALMVGLETSIPSNLYFVLASSVLLAGGVAVAASLAPRAGSPPGPAS